MRISLRDACDSTRRVVVLSLLAFACLVWAREAPAYFPAFSSEQKNDQSELPPGEITAQVKYWSTRCAQFENNAAASQCWLDAAKVLDRYAGTHSLTDHLKELRMDWLLRGLLLSLKASEPESYALQEGRHQPSPREYPEPAGVVGPDFCASIPSSDYTKCLDETTPPGVVPKTLVQPRKTEGAVPKVKRKKPARVKAARAKVETKPLRQARNEKVIGPVPLSPEAAGLPVRLNMPRKRNFTSSYPN